jgi:hypothetical protein
MVFWVVTLLSLEDINVSEESAGFAFRVNSSMKIETVSSSEMQVSTYKTT